MTQSRLGFVIDDAEPIEVRHRWRRAGRGSVRPDVGTDRSPSGL